MCFIGIQVIHDQRQLSVFRKVGMQRLASFAPHNGDCYSDTIKLVSIQYVIKVVGSYLKKTVRIYFRTCYRIEIILVE